MPKGAPTTAGLAPPRTGVPVSPQRAARTRTPVGAVAGEGGRAAVPAGRAAPGRIRRARLALFPVLAVAGALLLGGCSSGDTGRADVADGAGGGTGRQAPPAPGGTARGPDGSGGVVDGDARDAAPEEDLVSTFALDVDTASYGYARRALADGRLPDPSAVRPEEFVNSFRQDYPRPDGDGFTVTVDGARTGDGDEALVRVGLATRDPGPRADRPPAALTFVVDVSGSMAEPGRLDLARRALAAMTRELRDDDAVALVAFSDEAECVLPMTRLGGHRARVLDAVRRLRTEDSTYLAAGLDTGYATAGKGLRRGAANRVVLVSDALANTGDTEPAAILERVARERREHGITLFGVGVGSEYGDSLMEELADRGDGHTAYVADDEGAREVFVEQLPRHVDLVARDAKAQVVFDARTVASARLVGYDNRRVAGEDFRDDRVDGGEVGPGHTVTALYAVRLRPGVEGPLATARVRWQDPDSRAPREAEGRLRAWELEGDLWEAAPRLRVDAVAAYFADALREDAPGVSGRALPGAPTWRELEFRARELARVTEDEDVAELARAVARARDLM